MSKYENEHERQQYYIDPNTFFDDTDGRGCKSGPIHVGINSRGDREINILTNLNLKNSDTDRIQKEGQIKNCSDRLSASEILAVTGNRKKSEELEKLGLKTSILSPNPFFDPGNGSKVTAGEKAIFASTPFIIDFERPMMPLALLEVHRLKQTPVGNFLNINGLKGVVSFDTTSFTLVGENSQLIDSSYDTLIRELTLLSSVRSMLASSPEILTSKGLSAFVLNTMLISLANGKSFSQTSYIRYLLKLEDIDDAFRALKDGSSLPLGIGLQNYKHRIVGALIAESFAIDSHHISRFVRCIDPDLFPEISSTASGVSRLLIAHSGLSLKTE
jgi:hypothetical protein